MSQFIAASETAASASGAVMARGVSSVTAMPSAA